MKKTAISLLVVLALVLSFVLVAAPNAVAAAEPHTHCICGGNCAAATKANGHNCDNSVVWTDLNANLASYRKVDGTKVWYELPTGNYYLSTNLDISDATGKDAAFMLIKADVSICLNGFKLSLSGNTNIRMFCDAADAAKSLTFCDCKGTGEVYGGNYKSTNDTAANGQLVRLGKAAGSTATLNIFGGKFSAVAGDANTGALFRLGDSGKTKVTFNMYGGTITGGKATSQGGNIALYCAMNMYGGAVTNGVAATKGSNIVLITGGTATIKGGQISGGSVNDIEVAYSTTSVVVNIQDLDASAVVKVVNSEQLNYNDNNLTKTGNTITPKALEAADNIIQLNKNYNTAIVLTKDTVIDLNGYNLSGTITRNGHKLYVVDTTTEDFDCANGYGKLSASIDGAAPSASTVANFNGGKVPFADTVKNNQRYVLLPEDDGSWSAHRIYLGITDISLKTKNDGSNHVALAVGYSTQLKGDARVQALVTQYGLKAYLVSSNAVSGVKTGNSEFVAGSEGTKVAVHINNILTKDGEQNANIVNAMMEIKAVAVMQFGDRVIESSEYAFQLQDAVERIDAVWNEKISEEQKAFVGAVYAAFYQDMKNWEIPNIKGDSGITLPTISPETESALRQQVVDRMRQILTVAWTPVDSFSITASGETHTFHAGTTYYGFPYGSECMSWEQFQSYIVSVDANGVATVKPQNSQSFRIDCADAVYWSWSQISSGISFSLTGNAMCQNGVKPVGTYKYDMSLAVYDTRADFFTYVKNKNTAQTMYQAYAQLKPGDAVLMNGHMMMVAEAPTVKNSWGDSISGSSSKVLIYEQNAKGYQEDGSTNEVEGYKIKEYTFSELWEKTYIPLTIEAFTYGEDPEAAAVVNPEGASIAQFTTQGVILSNYRVNGVQIRIQDDKGMQEVVVYPYNHNNNNSTGGNYDIPNNGNIVDMADLASTKKTEFANFVKGLSLTAGKQYTYEVYVRTGNGDTWDFYGTGKGPVETMTFTHS